MSQTPPGLPPAPIPVQPIGYSSIESTRRRPGLVTGIGIASIIIGSLHILTNLMQLMAAVVTFAAIGMTTRVPPATVAPPATMPAALYSDEELDLAVATLAKLQPLTPAHQKEVRHLLALQGPTILSLPPGSVTEAAVRMSVTYASSSADTVWYSLGAGTLTVDATSASFTHNSGMTFMSTSTQPVATTMPPPVPVSVQTSTRDARFAAGFLADAVLSVLLAIYLIVAGAIVLKGSFIGARLHWIYVLIKLPLALLSALLAILWIAELAGDIGPRGVGYATFWIVAVAVLSLAYPVVLLFVLRSRTVREFFDRGRAV